MVIRKEPIGDTVNPRILSQEDNVTDNEKVYLRKTTQTFRNKVDYEGDTDEKSRFTDDSLTQNPLCIT